MVSLSEAIYYLVIFACCSVAVVIFAAVLIPKALAGVSCAPNPFEFECRSGYTAAFYSCPDAQKFENVTGQYCGGRLVCENKLKEVVSNG